jgi:predicted small integral membrane protein
VSQYLKFFAQVFATALAALVAALYDDRVDFGEWLNAGVLALGAVAVLGAGDLPAGVWRYTKPIVAAASAVLVLWQSLASNGMVPAEWIQLVLAALGALGVLAAPGPKVEQVGRHAA